MKFCTNFRKKAFAKHFIQLGRSINSVYRWIDVLLSKKTLDRRVGSGRPLKISIKRYYWYFETKSIIERLESKKCQTD
jgi:transcription initiation factor IIE alpha subunit